MIKILYVNGSLMDRGGISVFLMNCFNNIDRSIIQIDFAVIGNGEGTRDKEIKEAGAKIFGITSKSENLFKHISELKKVIHEGGYTVVHANCDAGNALVLKIAKQCAVPVRISHSHNTDFLTNNRFRLFINKVQRTQIPRFATSLWACSYEAGRWLYGDNKSFEIIHNAIQLDKFEYSEDLRKKYRDLYGIRNKYVIGNIGRFDYQKNQSFLLSVFAEIIKKNPDSCLMLVGDGVDRPKIERQIESLGITDRVILTGQVENTNEILNAFDVFVLPSHFEGLGIALIEAQANGVYCIVSTGIPLSSDVTSRVKYLSLDEGNDEWIENILSVKSRAPKSIEKVRDAGYDIHLESKRIQDLYIELATNHS